MRTRASFFAFATVFAALELIAAAPAAAVTCDVGLFKSPDGTCTSSCPSSSFGDAKTGTCKSCYSTSYKSCTSARVGAATACVQGYYLKGGRCMAEANIPAGSYGTADGKVVNCGDGVQKCSAAGIESCKANYTLSNGKCVACPVGSSACSSPTIATACNTGYFLSNGQCNKNCPASTFANTATAKCQPCFAPSYTSCTNARSSSATACITGYYLTGGRCMPASAVPKGKYGGSDGKLHLCPTGQATCTEAGPTTCKTGYTLSADKTQCEVQPACPAHAVCENGTVKSCSDGWLLYKDSCVENCPSQTYSFVERGACYDSCPSDSWSHDMSHCGEPGINCPQRLYDEAWKCYSCGQNALTCAEDHAITCKNDQYVVQLGTNGYYNDCYYVGCPVGQYVQGFDETCVPCPMDNAELCRPRTGELIRCKEGYAQKTGSNGEKSCVPLDECGPEQQATESQYNGYFCGNCYIDGATRCDKNGSAQKCSDGYTLTPDSNNEREGRSICVAEPVCPPHSICDASDKVVSCSDGYLLYNGQCVDHCPTGVFYYAQKAACYDQCPARSWHYDMSTCYGTCPQRWIDNEFTCTDCGLNAEACDQNHATQCISDQYTVFQDNNGQYHNCAFIGCPSGSYAPDWNDVCAPCPGGENVDLCFPINGRTIKCKDGYASTSGNEYGTCVPIDSCPQGEYPTDTQSNGKVCSQCPYTWSGVTECDQQGVATKCSEGLHLEADPNYNGDILCVANTAGGQ